MGLQVLRLTRETTFGVFPTAPAAGTQIDVFLPMGNDFTVRPMLKQAPIRDAGQGNRKVRMINGRTDIGGSLNTYFFPSQAPYLIGLVAGLVGTNPCYDLPSFSCDHGFYTDRSCASFFRRYLGCKFGKASISCDDSDTGFLATFKADIIGSTFAEITLTDFPSPALAAYPGEDPFQFYHTAEGAGKLFINSARHDYYNLNIDISNMMKGFGGEQRHTQLVTYEGRDIGLSATLLLKSQADRQLYEAGGHQTVQVEFDNGTHSILFDFGTAVNIDAVADQMPLGDKYTQQVSFSSLVDATVTIPTDLTVTTT